MKRTVKWLLIPALLGAILALTLTSCAEPPEKQEETEAETESYTPPPKDYLAKLAEDPGYLDWPDSVWCYQAGLISPDALVPLDEIVFDLSCPADERFLSSHYSYLFEQTVDAGGDEQMNVTQMPNANFLTLPDGTRVKLCPVPECQAEYGELCTHIDLSQGKVIGDWIYFVGNNACLAAPHHPDRLADGSLPLLLRYSIAENRVEKVMTLPFLPTSVFAAYGVLYLRKSQDTWWLVGDCDAAVPKIAELAGSFRAGKAEGGFLWYLDGNAQLHRCAPDGSDDTILVQLNEGDMLLAVRDGAAVILRRNTDESAELLSVDEKGRETVLLDGLYQAAATERWLYAVRYENRAVFDVQRRDDVRTIYTQAAGRVLRYEWTKDGLLNPGSETVIFDEASDPSEAGEFLYGIAPFGDLVRIQTVFAPPLEEENLCGSRYYLPLEDGMTVDGEEMLRTYRGVNE